MADKRVTKRWLKNHWTYSWWKYLLSAVLCVMGVNLLFTATAYRPPEEKKVEIYVLNGYIDAAALQADLWPEFSAAYPDQEELTVMNINMVGGDMYAAMQFSAYVAAGQGDVCLLPLSEVGRMASDGAEYAFMELTPYIESGVIDVEGIDLSAGRMKDSGGVEGIYGIPADSLYGLYDFTNNPADSLLCIFDYNGNDDHSAAMLGMMLERYRTEKPETLEKTPEQKQEPMVLF